MSKSPDLEFKVRWLPYQLAPQSSEEPMDRVDAYAAKFGRSREQAQSMLQGMAQRFKQEGLPYKVEDAKVANSKEAHRVLAAAFKEGGHSAQDKVAEVLFHGYFGEGKSPNDPALLEAALDAAGLSKGIVGDRTICSGEVEEELKEGRKFVTSGVPHFMIGPEGGKAVSEFAGAQPVDEFLSAFAAASKQ